MSSRTYGADEKAKLERLVNEGANVMREVEDLQEGLKETVKAVSQELDIKGPQICKLAFDEVLLMKKVFPPHVFS